jgi:hypothetical protein
MLVPVRPPNRPGDHPTVNQPDHTLIPPPAAVREQLAQNLRENRLLRALLRVSERAAEQRYREQAPTSTSLAAGREVTHEG